MSHWYLHYSPEVQDKLIPLSTHTRVICITLLYLIKNENIL